MSYFRRLLLANASKSVGGDDWTDGYSLTNVGEVIKNDKYAISKYIPIQPSIKYGWYGPTAGLSFSNDACLNEFDEHKQLLDFWTATNRAVTARSNGRYIRFTCPINEKDNWYVKDITNDKYLYKGQNIN